MLALFLTPHAITKTKKNLETIKFIFEGKTLLYKLNQAGKLLFDHNSERRLKAFANACNLKHKEVN